MSSTGSLSIENYGDVSEAIYQSVLKNNEDRRIPTNVMIELTRICSIKCTHCYIGDARWVKNPNELKTEEIIELLDVLAEKGTLWVCFTGGEATAHKDFKKLWLHAKKKGFIMTLFTNATLMTDELTEFLMQYPPFKVEVSIYGGSREIYERVSQVKGSFARFMRGIKNIHRAGFNWDLKTVLIQENAKELGLMKSIADEYGVKFKFDSNINPSIGKEDHGGKAPCGTRVDSEFVIDTEFKSKERVESYQNLDEYVGGNYTRGASLYSCGAGKNNVYIDSEGNVQMCVLTGHIQNNIRSQLKNPLRDTMSKSFDWAWDSFGELRKIKLKKDSPCHNCDIATLCENCPGFAYLENGDEHSAVEFLCKQTHEKAKRMGIKHNCDHEITFL